MRLREGKSRVVVCVDMLGEGFDLPQLKIAAIHDTHKSLAVLLQFTGRFTRSAAKNIGDATVIANIANVSVSSALNRLYSEDADWNHLLQEFSSDAIKQHMALLEFLRKSKPIEDDESDEESARFHSISCAPNSAASSSRSSASRPRSFSGPCPTLLPFSARGSTRITTRCFSSRGHSRDYSGPFPGSSRHSVGPVCPSL